MRIFVVLVTLLCCCTPLFSQQTSPSLRPVAHFEVKGASRLAALAKAGALTKTTILVEAGPLPYLQEPVSFAADQNTMGELVRAALGDGYRWRELGALLIVEPVLGPKNRLLLLPLGEFNSTGSTLSDLYPYLEYMLHVATGCKVSGYAWAGPSMGVGLPAIHLADATLELVLSRVADAQSASMWIVPVERSQYGCVESPFRETEVGIYGFGARFADCQQPFSSSVGENLLGDVPKQKAFPDDCVKTYLSKW